MMFLKKKEKIDKNNLPRHIGIIMDGNGRWAKKRGMPRTFGHRFGAETLEKISVYCGELGVKAITAYAFSTENWKRPKEEVDAIMDLLLEYLKNAEERIGGRNVVIRVIGDRTPLSEEIKEQIIKTEELTKNNTGIVLNIALNYGGRDEVVYAVKQALKNGKSPEELTEDDITNNLYAFDSPPVDLIIRPSGEYRLSNFLLWQSAYAEFWFSSVLWPDFSKKDMERAILDYQKRNRRYGGV